MQHAPYAVRPEASRGRLHPEPEPATRGPWQRDRDRIIHSSAFRKLQYKTQVFVNHEGDFFRTRLTHSIEVAQIARSIARELRLDEDLTEALALAHDLGHTPFGHAGEEALNLCTKPWGGFDHNGQSLRIVTKLESRYAAFDGLNLTWETLEGLAKHNGPVRRPAPAIQAYNRLHDLELATHASAEAQAAALAQARGLDADAVKKLADLESREVLLAKLAGGMKANLTKAAVVFDALPSKAARGLGALQEKAQADPSVIGGAGEASNQETDTNTPEASDAQDNTNE